MNPTDADIPLIDRPCFVQAHATPGGAVWVYRSVLVTDTDPWYLHLWTTVVAYGGQLVLSDEFDDEMMMFGKAKLEVWQL